MVRLENVLKISLQDVLKMSWRYLEDVFKTSWRCLEDIWPRRIYWSWPRHLEDVRLRRTYSSWSRRLQDVFKTSSEDEDERRLYQDECLLGYLFHNFLNWSKFSFVCFFSKINSPQKNAYVIFMFTPQHLRERYI